MKTKLFRLPKAVVIIASVFACAALAARADIEDKITKSFTVSPGGQLVVAVDRGSIEIKTAEVDAVNLVVTRKAGGSQGKAEQILKDHVVTATQDGNKVEVLGAYKGDKSYGLLRRGPDLQVSVVLTIPRRFDVDLKTAGGHILVVDLSGKLKAQTSGGNLNFERIDGPVSGQTSGGHIYLTESKGPVELKTSGGNLKLARIEGDITASTSGGHISADTLTGKSVVKTSGGNIDVKGIKGSIEARTSGGNVTAALVEQPTGDCLLNTSGGNISVSLTEKVAVEIDAHTSGGRISSALPVVAKIQGEQKRNDLRGKINGGGPLIKAHTSGGNVRLEKS